MQSCRQKNKAPEVDRHVQMQSTFCVESCPAASNAASRHLQEQLSLTGHETSAHRVPEVNFLFVWLGFSDALVDIRRVLMFSASLVETIVECRLRIRVGR